MELSTLFCGVGRKRRWQKGIGFPFVDGRWQKGIGFPLVNGRWQKGVGFPLVDGRWQKGVGCNQKSIVPPQKKCVTSRCLTATRSLSLLGPATWQHLAIILFICCM